MAIITPIIRVFISSTFADFQMERNALHKIVFPRLRRYCLERGAHFLPIDLRWGVSEAASLDQRIFTICQDEIRHCQEASPFFNFFALLGDRYGSRLLPEVVLQVDANALFGSMASEEVALFHLWYRLDQNFVPAVYTLQSRNTREDAWKHERVFLQEALQHATSQVSVSAATYAAITASVTEREIGIGIFQTPKNDHALCLFRIIEQAPADVRPYPYFETEAANRTSIVTLKQRLRKRLPTGIVTFKARWHKETLGTDHLDAFCRLVEQHLIERVNIALGRQIEQHNSVTDPLIRWPFAQRRLDHFTGRTEALQLIRNYLANITSAPLIVTGPPGIGKTSLLLQAAREARATFPNALQLSYFIGGNTSISDVPALLSDLYTRLLGIYPHPDGLTIPDDLNFLIDKMRDFLALVTAEYPLILIVDALDQLRGTRITQWIPEALPPNVRIIVSMLPGTDCDEIFRRLAAEQTLGLGPLPFDQGAILLEKWLRAAGRTLQAGQREIILQLYAANPNPLYLDLLFQEARRWSSYQEPLPILAGDTQGLLDTFFDRLEEPAEHGRLLVTRVLGLIAAGREGLREGELLDVLNQDQKALEAMTKTHPDAPKTDTFPPVLWARLHADLEAYLTERKIVGGIVLGFYHRQVDEVVRQRYLSSELRIARHRDLAYYFARQNPYLINTTEYPFALVNTRMVNELAYQQDQADLPDDLKVTLTNATFLQARISARKVEDAVTDTDLMEDEADIRLLGEVVI